MTVAAVGKPLALALHGVEKDKKRMTTDFFLDVQQVMLGIVVMKRKINANRNIAAFCIWFSAEAYFMLIKGCRSTGCRKTGLICSTMFGNCHGHIKIQSQGMKRPLEQSRTRRFRYHLKNLSYTVLLENLTKFHLILLHYQFKKRALENAFTLEINSVFKALQIL